MEQLLAFVEQASRILMKPVTIFGIDDTKMVTFVCLLLFAMFICNRLWIWYVRKPRKTFTVADCTNIVITGGAMGLGKQLAEQFIRRNPLNSINLIIIDIRSDLESELRRDLQKASGSANFKNFTFYKANLAEIEQTKTVWEKIIQDHGVVHILVNNHAIC